MQLKNPAADGTVYSVVFANPALASGLKNYVSISTDYGDADVTVAYFTDHWILVTNTVRMNDREWSIGPYGVDVRKFSVRVTSVTASNTVVAVDVLSTLSS